MSVVTIEINGIKKELKTNDVIHCNTIEKAKKLLTALKENGIKWCSGDSLDKNYYEDYGSNTCYHFATRGLEFSPIDFYTKNGGYCVYTFDELFNTQIAVDYNELYDLIKKIVLDVTDGGLTQDELYECFNEYSYEDVLLNNTAEELIEKYYKWTELKEAEQEIKVGDIFKFKQWDDEEDQYIVISIDKDDDQYIVLWKDGSTGTYEESEILEDEKIGHKEVPNFFD